MSEGFPTMPSKEALGSRKERITTLVRELMEGKESLPFPGLKVGAYEALKAADEESRGTPIDELLERFKSEGMKVVPGKYLESGVIFVLPAKSDDIENDSILLKNLEVGGETDPKLKELI